MSKEAFKSFARNHEELAMQVMSNKTTWQKLYELYDIYGEESEIWKNYFSSGNKEVTSIKNESTTSTEAPTTFKDFFNTFKNLDLDSVQKGVTNLQKTIGLLQDIGLGGTTNNSSNTGQYEPRPMYKYFED